MIKFHSKYPQNYYATSKEKLKQLRIQANNIVPIPLPIAKSEFYKELLKRHRNKNQRYKDELEVCIFVFLRMIYLNKINFLGFFNKVSKNNLSNYI